MHAGSSWMSPAPTSTHVPEHGPTPLADCLEGWLPQEVSPTLI